MALIAAACPQGHRTQDAAHTLRPFLGSPYRLSRNAEPVDANLQ